MKMLRNSSIILLVFVVCVKHLFAAPSGNIQLLLAAPDPATAGDKILFQIIALNTGAEIWKNSQYFFEVEIYDANKNYIIKIIGDNPAEHKISRIKAVSVDDINEIENVILNQPVPLGTGLPHLISKMKKE